MDGQDLQLHVATEPVRVAGAVHTRGGEATSSLNVASFLQTNYALVWTQSVYYSVSDAAVTAGMY